MARPPRRPRISLKRIIGGALVDAARRAPAIAAMAVVALAGPWVAVLTVTREYRHVDPIGPLSFLFGAIVLLSTLMQSILVASATKDLRRVRADGMLDLRAAGLRFAGDLALNIIGLALVVLGTLAVSGVLLVALYLIGAAVAALNQTSTDLLDANFGWFALTAAVIGAAPPVLFLSRWAIAIPAAHIEGRAPPAALQRSAEATTGQRLRIAALQMGYLLTWPAMLFWVIYPSISLKLSRQNSELLIYAGFALLGVLAAVEALGKVRLYRELATTAGEVGSSALVDVFG